MRDDGDEVLESVAEALKGERGPGAQLDRRVMAAVRALPRHGVPRRHRLAATTIAAAAAMLVILARSRATDSATASARAVDDSVQFTIVAPTASRVVVVGDFNGWDTDSEAFEARYRGGGVWSVTALVPVGHHRYSFLLDDSLWVADPRAPGLEDSDFGIPSSALIVTGAD